MKILRWLLLLALLCFLVGASGAVTIWKRSSDIPTEQYTHHYEMSLDRYNNRIRPFYMTDEQERSFESFNTLMYVGLWSLCAVMAAIIIFGIAAKNRPD